MFLSCKMLESEDMFDKFSKTVGILRSIMAGRCKNTSQCTKWEDAHKLKGTYLNGINEILERAMTELSNHTGRFLHELDRKQPDLETLRKIIAAAPSSLMYKNDLGQLPIHAAAWGSNSVKYIPLLAQEGIYHMVWENEKRGGLLEEDGYRCNVLQLLTSMESKKSYPEHFDVLCLDVMKELEQTKLFVKTDLKDFDLLLWACHPPSRLRFEHLVGWGPEGLKTHQFRQMVPILHAIIQYRAIDCFSTFFASAIKFYPEYAGLIFLKDSFGTTACELAFKKYGKDETFQAITNCIPLYDKNLPILHCITKFAPQFMNDFAKRYPEAVYLRDNQGRTLTQVELASGTKSFNNNVRFFTDVSDDELRQTDPVTNLYPFMVMALDQSRDLSAGYYLLRRNPSVAYQCCKEEY